MIISPLKCEDCGKDWGSCEECKAFLLNDERIDKDIIKTFNLDSSKTDEDKPSLQKDETN